ncbi:hypothetical protein RF55_11202 [Lasius niger]|uniref:Reverse transcriptase domain-containing protein n=1 Tax=Lasius niger TaxID=67767 RepID=A0A0J7KFJ3_LASNI|nr:hypothetical protein RF55_11202 [Lasius niger]
MSEEWTEIKAHVATGKTSWIYSLSKNKLVEICDYYNIKVKSTADIDEIRKTLAEFVKERAEKEKQKITEKNPENIAPSASKIEAALDDVMAPNIGKLIEFESEKQTWEDYIEQLEFYLEANNISNESKKRATLLTAIGAKNYAIIKSLCSPTAPKDVTYQDILDKCKSYFGQNLNELLARVHFHKRIQRENETLKEFVREIRKLALDCKFTGPDGQLPLNIMLRDRFVAGIRNEEMQRYLCQRHEESISDTNPDGLTLEKALEIACNAESAEQQQKIFKQSESEVIQNVTQNTTNKQTNKKNTKQRQTRDPCYRCGYTNHSQDKCFYKNEKCSYCEKVGHIVRVCKIKQRSNEKQTKIKQAQTHPINEDSSDESDDDNILACNAIVQSLQEKRNDDEYVVQIEINSKLCKFEVDNGAHLSLINKQTYEKIWPKKEPTWLKKRIKLYGYGKKPLQVIGATNVLVRHRQIKKLLPIVVTNETHGPNLLGRNWFAELGITMTGIHKVSEKENNGNNILKKFPSLTLKTLEGHKGTPIHIELKDNAHPKFFKARRIPYGLQEAAMDALKSMVQQKMLTPVNQSDWATPVLFVRKPNGKIRVVGDYKSTVNPEIRKSEYPLPTVEEALATLNGGEYFSQVDLRDAYKQLCVDEETSKILTISTPGGLFNVNRLLDGIAAAPRIFQKFMTTILSGIHGIQIYLDNVKIQGKTLDEHNQRLTEVLKRLQDSNLRINVKKSIFSVKSMEFLGHQISTEGIQPLENKVTAIREMKAPTNKRELQVFLGGINFYARFIQNRATIAEPLHRLLDADAEWKWSKQEKNAFKELKNQLIGSGILIHFDDNLPIVLSADASPIGIGAVLAHKFTDQTEKPIAYFSKTLNKTQRQYAQLD